MVSRLVLSKAINHRWGTPLMRWTGGTWTCPLGLCVSDFLRFSQSHLDTDRPRSMVPQTSTYTSRNFDLGTPPQKLFIDMRLLDR